MGRCILALESPAVAGMVKPYILLAIAVFPRTESLSVVYPLFLGKSKFCKISYSFYFRSMMYKLVGSGLLKESDRGKHAYQLDGRHQPIP